MWVGLVCGRILKSESIRSWNTSLLYYISQELKKNVKNAFLNKLGKYRQLYWIVLCQPDTSYSHLEEGPSIDKIPTLVGNLWSIFLADDWYGRPSSLWAVSPLSAAPECYKEANRAIHGEQAMKQHSSMSFAWVPASSCCPDLPSWWTI